MLRTTMIYTHVLNRPGLAVSSPLDINQRANTGGRHPGPIGPGTAFHGEEAYSRHERGDADEFDDEDRCGPDSQDLLFGAGSCPV